MLNIYFSFFFWPLYCLSFDFRLMIILLVSSNFSCVCFTPWLFLCTLKGERLLLILLSLLFKSRVEGGGRGVPLTDLTSLHVCVCPKPGPGFTTSYVMVFLVFSVLRLDVIVHFVDIVGIVNHHCLNYLFIKSFPFKF